MRNSRNSIIFHLIVDKIISVFNQYGCQQLCGSVSEFESECERILIWAIVTERNNLAELVKWRQSRNSADH